MYPVSETPEVLNAVKSGVGDSALQPQAGVDPPLAHDSASEPDARLDHDTRFLGIDRHGPASPRDRGPSPEGCAQGRRLASEVIGKATMSTRMPQVTRNEPVAALGTTPQGQGSSACGAPNRSRFSCGAELECSQT